MKWYKKIREVINNDQIYNKMVFKYHFMESDPEKVIMLFEEICLFCFTDKRFELYYKITGIVLNKYSNSNNTSKENLANLQDIFKYFFNAFYLYL
jgi:hypothetical protein